MQIHRRLRLAAAVTLTACALTQPAAGDQPPAPQPVPGATMAGKPDPLGRPVRPIEPLQAPPPAPEPPARKHGFRERWAEYMSKHKKSR